MKWFSFTSRQGFEMCVPLSEVRGVTQSEDRLGVHIIIDGACIATDTFDIDGFKTMVLGMEPTDTIKEVA